jgi:hypothetical protein
MISIRLTPVSLVPGALLLPVVIAAQTPAHDPSNMLEQVLPPSVAQQVLARIADARSRDLPAAALEHRALELRAKGASPAGIPGMIAQTEDAMATGKAALAAGGRAHASDTEVEAAGTAVSKGVDGATISSLAKSAPSGRTLAVPLAVLTALVDRGLPADDALARVLARLKAHASDQALAALPEQADNGLGHKPATTGEAHAASKRPDAAGPPSSTPAGTTPAGITPPVAAPPSSVPVGSGQPTSLPTNGGQGSRPTTPTHPTGRP